MAGGRRPGQLRSWWTTLFPCGEYDEAADRLKPLLASHRIDLQEDSIEFKQLASEGMRYAIAAFQEAEETIEAGRLDDGALVRLRRQLGRLPTDSAATGGLCGGNVVDVFSRTALPPRPNGRSPDSEPAAVPFPSSFDVPVTTDLLRKVYTKFVEAKQEAGAWKQEAVDDAWKALELFEELIGVMSIGDVEHSHANAFRARILLLPKYHGKGRFTDKSPRDAIALVGEFAQRLQAELASALEAGEISREEHETRLAEGLIPRCGPKTVNKHLDYLGGCIKWANKHYGWKLVNGFADNRFSKRDLRKTGRRRRAMKNEELAALFTTPLFTGCASENRRSLPGKIILKDAVYWVPLIVSFTGGRLEEICQLTVNNIIEVDCTWCIKISNEDDDQETKTESAQRLVPLHSTLLKLGLVDRCLDLRAKGERRLFPELTAGGRYGRYGYRLTKSWTHYRRQVGLYEPGKDFHTLRHSFNTHLLNKKVPVVWMSQLMGHATSGQTAGHAVNFETASTYYGGAEVADLKQAVEQFDFGLKLEERDGEWQIAR